MTDYRLKASGIFPSGRPWSTRVHGSSTDDAATVLINWALQWTSAWTNGTHGLELLYPTAFELNQLAVVELTPLFRESLSVVSPSTLVGTSTAEGMPEQTCILASLRNVNSGAKNRWRMYLPAPAEDAASMGVLTPTLSARASTAINALFDGMRTSGLTFFVYNSDTNVHDPVAFTKKTITSEKIDKVLRTQRRRIRSHRADYV